MRQKTGLERNLFHLGAGIVVVFLLYFGYIDAWVLAGITAAGFVISLAQKRKPVPVIDTLIRFFGRGEENGSFPGRGAVFMFFGMTLAAALFPEDIALASITILAVGDSLSPIIATRLNRIMHPLNREKVLDASTAGFFVAFLAGTFFVSLTESFIAAYIAMFVESVDYLKGRRIEDNITIPLVAGLSISVLRIFVLI